MIFVKETDLRLCILFLFYAAFYYIYQYTADWTGRVSLSGRGSIEITPPRMGTAASGNLDPRYPNKIFVKD